MIEKILERLEAKEDEYISEADDSDYFHGQYSAIVTAQKIVQEVAKEYGKDTNVRSSGWIPVTYHVATDEEREEMCLPDSITYILDCPMPDDGQEIIVCNERYVWTDTCMIDDGYSLDSGNDWCDDIVAWMPMPKKYEPKKQKGE